MTTRAPSSANRSTVARHGTLLPSVILPVQSNWTQSPSRQPSVLSPSVSLPLHAAGATWQRTDLAGALLPGQYYLVQEAVGAGGTTSLPTPDATGTIAMSATAGLIS